MKTREKIDVVKRAAGAAPCLLWYEEIGLDAIPLVGGKNASMGEMIQHLTGLGVVVPSGFAITAQAYQRFLRSNNLEARIATMMDAFHDGQQGLEQTGAAIRRLILEARFPDDMRAEIVDAYQQLGSRYGLGDADVAVRSSATAEDLPDASFAGQQESYLNVRGDGALMDACRKCFASLYTNRAISYREQKGFADVDVYLSVGVQKMVRSDRGAAGVLFTIDSDTGFPGVLVINAAYGLGENVVKGVVTPDEFRVCKKLIARDGVVPIIGRELGDKDLMMVYGDSDTQPVVNVPTPLEMARVFSLTDEQVMQLSHWALLIEDHYGKAMDIEWALDGDTGELAVVQARPETVHSQMSATSITTAKITGERPAPILKALGIGSSIATGEVMVIRDLSEANKFKPGKILVTAVTDPDWVPLMKVAAGLITDHGGRTSHAAIVSRELGVPAVIGTGVATEKLHNGQAVTINCADAGRGLVYEGILDYEITETSLSDLPETKTQVMLNIANPDAATYWWRLPSDGIGLARMEFIISNFIKIHPMALVRFDVLKDSDAWEEIQSLTLRYTDKTRYFVDRLSMGIARIAASQYPRPVIVRTSDFKTNEYRDLIGGNEFEPSEENPMLGFRGASRYYSDDYREGFALECKAIKVVRELMGLDNVIVMIPFCRTPEEADSVLGVLADNGLVRGEQGLEVYVMAEIPSNIILADNFAEKFDGFSIGSNDLTQLVLGIDRDSDKLAAIFDENHEAVRVVIRELIQRAHARGRKVGICGQAPSDKPEFARFLVESGIDSISLTPDSFAATKRVIAEQEDRLQR